MNETLMRILFALLLGLGTGTVVWVGDRSVTGRTEEEKKRDGRIWFAGAFVYVSLLDISRTGRPGQRAHRAHQHCR